MTLSATAMRRAATAEYQQFADLRRHIIKDARSKNSVAVITFNYDIAADKLALGPRHVIKTHMM